MYPKEAENESNLVLLYESRWIQHGMNHGEKTCFYICIERMKNETQLDYTQTHSHPLYWFSVFLSRRRLQIKYQIRGTGVNIVVYKTTKPKQHNQNFKDLKKPIICKHTNNNKKCSSQNFVQKLKTYSILGKFAFFYFTLKLQILSKYYSRSYFFYYTFY